MMTQHGAIPLCGTPWDMPNVGILGIICIYAQLLSPVSYSHCCIPTVSVFTCDTHHRYQFTHSSGQSEALYGCLEMLSSSAALKKQATEKQWSKDSNLEAPALLQTGALSPQTWHDSSQPQLSAACMPDTFGPQLFWQEAVKIEMFIFDYA